jgi:hypothetical protein
MNTTQEDLAYVAWQEEQTGLAEAAELRAYETWRDARLEDDPDEDASEEAYGDWLEALATDW